MKYCKIFLSVDDVKFTGNTFFGQKEGFICTTAGTLGLKLATATIKVIEVNQIEDTIKNYEEKIADKVKHFIEEHTEFQNLSFPVKKVEDFNFSVTYNIEYADKQSFKWCIENLTVEQFKNQFGFECHFKKEN